MSQYHNMDGIAVIQDGTVLDIYTSMSDCGRALGVHYSTILHRNQTGKEYDGLRYMRTSYECTPILCMLDGMLQITAKTLASASALTRVPQSRILSLIDSGDSYRCWTFDEVGIDAYPKTKFWMGRKYTRQEKGYKATEKPCTYLHRDMWEQAYGEKIEGRKNLKVRNANMWDFTVEDLALVGKV